MIAFIVVCWLIAVCAGFIMGKHYERFAWNELIHKGILPKPKK